MNKGISHYLRNSGPGWIQAAVTLGGGTLVSSLYLGVIGGYRFMWLLPLSMLCGIIMLYALSYITLSKEDDRPFHIVKKHISPALAWGWLGAAVLANVVFCASQFALATDAIQGNLGGQNINSFTITTLLVIIVMTLIWFFSAESTISNIINGIIKMLVAIVVLSFMGVVIVLTVNGSVDWLDILRGLIPDFSMMFRPSPSYAPYLDPGDPYSAFWTDYITSNQRNIIIGAFGTAVGINMTFLVPYSIYKRKWDKSMRKFAGFDLILGLFIPFTIGACCLVISTASQFHGRTDSYVSQQAYHEVLDSRLSYEHLDYKGYTDEQKTLLREASSDSDKKLSQLLAKRNASDLSNALTPFLGQWANLIFGIGILAMAISTMLVHMMINGYAISEATGNYGSRKWFLIGAAIPAISGWLSPIIWAGDIKAAIVIPASVIATTLLPIAYITFLLLMNSKKVLGNELPHNRTVINVFLSLATLIAIFASCWALIGKMSSPNRYECTFGWLGLILLLALTVIGIRSFLKNENKVV